MILRFVSCRSTVVHAGVPPKRSFVKYSADRPVVTRTPRRASDSTISRPTRNRPNRDTFMLPLCPLSLFLRVALISVDLAPIISYSSGENSRIVAPTRLGGGRGYG